MATRALQKIFERSANSAGITGHSIHHLRHTYASYLLKASNFNVVLVKEQLGHSSIKVTEVYLHVLRPDLQIALDSLYSDLTTPK
jgi:site-specific recombinase XerD